MKCNNCSQEYDDNYNVCPYCGTPKGAQVQYQQPPQYQPQQQQQYQQYQQPPVPEPQASAPLLLTTCDVIDGKKTSVIGLVTGSTVHSVHIGKDFLAGFKTIVGGELNAYTEMMQEARKVATGRMIVEAKQLGADAIVCMRYASSSVTQGAAEIIAYGTAVKFED